MRQEKSFMVEDLSWSPATGEHEHSCFYRALGTDQAVQGILAVGYVEGRPRSNEYSLTAAHG